LGLGRSCGIFWNERAFRQRVQEIMFFSCGPDFQTSVDCYKGLIYGKVACRLSVEQAMCELQGGIDTRVGKG